MAAAGRLLRFAPLALLLLACAPPSAPWRVEVAGCESWTAGPTCTLGAAGASRLRIWVAGEEALRAELDGQATALAARPADGGQILELEVPAQSRRLRLERARGPAFDLALGPSRLPAWYAEVKAAWSDADWVKVKALLARVGETPLDRAFRRLYEARLAYFLDDDRAAAVQLAGEAGELFASLGLHGYAITERTFASQQAIEDTRLDVSRRQLEAAAAPLEELDQPGLLAWQAQLAMGHQRTLLALRSGDVRGAWARWQDLAAVLPHQLASLDEQLQIEDLHVQMLAELGRFDDAMAVQERLLQQPLEQTADRAHLMHNFGWLALLAQQAEQGSRDPRPFFAWAWEYYGRQGVGQDQLKVLLNQGAAELEAGRTDEARRYLAAAEARLDAAGPRQLFDYKELEAQLYLAEGRHQAALELFEQLDTEAALRRLPGLQWRALVGRGRAQAAAGHGEDAVRIFELAELLENRDLIFISIDQGRETFLARRGKVVRQHLELLLAQDQIPRALGLVRRRRAQTLRLLRRDELLAALPGPQRQLWERTAADYRRLQQAIETAAESPPETAPWESRRGGAAAGRRGEELSRLIDAGFADLGLPPRPLELAEPRPGELILAFFPLADSWLLFADDGARPPRVVKAGGQDLAKAAGELLAAVKSEIEASRRLKILPWGGLDYHAILVDGRPLIALKPVAYGVDASSGGRPAEPPGRQAVLVGDTWSLRRPASEIRMARQALESHGFAIGATLLGQGTTPAAVRAALENADFFHFAGHSYFDGEAGSQSRLSLAGGDLPASDVFALRRVPRRVLLSSCEGGQAHRAGEVEGLGLAQAFVLAGADQVLATTRRVEDRQAADLIASLYRHLFTADGGGKGGELDLAAALQAAQIELAAAGQGTDWQAFRVFEP